MFFFMTITPEKQRNCWLLLYPACSPPLYKHSNEKPPLCVHNSLLICIMYSALWQSGFKPIFFRPLEIGCQIFQPLNIRLSDFNVSNRISSLLKSVWYGWSEGDPELRFFFLFSFWLPFFFTFLICHVHASCSYCPLSDKLCVPVREK